MPHSDTDSPGGIAFQSTSWTDIVKARDRSSPECREALERLFVAYWKPVYHFIRRRGRDVEASKDLTQGFFAAFLERDFLRYVDKGRGKFRTFLLTALEHYLADEYDKTVAQKRGSGRLPASLDFLQAEAEIVAGRTDPPDRAYLRQWALQVVERALKALRDEYEAAGRKAEFEALRAHLMADAAPSYAEVGRSLGASEGDIKNWLHRARQRFRDLVLAEIRVYSDGDPDDELRELFDALS